MRAATGNVDPGINNFAIGSLILGQTSTGSTSRVELMLRNQYDNHRGDAGAPEAVYVSNLTMYANSVLYLNTFNLYYKNSGTWQKATAGSFAPGDGTGRIYRPESGTLILIQ
jgi:hypothetical protein